MQLNQASSQDDIQKLLDEDKYMAVVNNAGWPPEKHVTLANRIELMNGIIEQELVHKRERVIAAFGRGLEVLGLRTLMCQHPQEFRCVFVYQNQPLTAKTFTGLIVSKPPLGKRKLRVYQWFMQYIQDRESTGMCVYTLVYSSYVIIIYCTANDIEPELATLTDILKFCTAYEEPPPMGLCNGITCTMVYCQHPLPASIKLTYPTMTLKKSFIK